MKTTPAIRPSSRTLRPRRVVLLTLSALCLVYGLFVTTGYAWLSYGLKNKNVTFLEVALFRWKAIRRDMAAQQLREAELARKKGEKAAAYAAFSSALRNDPGNSEIRRTLAGFLRSSGASKMAVTCLEDGLESGINDPRFVADLLETLLENGSEERVLELVRGRLAKGCAPEVRALLPKYELQATLSTEGAPAAKALMEKQGSTLSADPDSSPIVACVLWASRDRLAAIDLLSSYLQKGRGNIRDFSLLAGWQQEGGMATAARETAQAACARYPADAAARIILLDVLQFGSRDWGAALQSYVSEFGASPQALLQLSEQAARRGWSGLAYALYSAGSARFANLAPLALCYAEALMATGRFGQARAALEQIDLQLPDNNQPLFARLRERQIVTAAALGDREGAREYARRLGNLLRGNDRLLRAKQRQFERLRIPEASEELAKSLGPTTASASAKAP